MTDVLDLIDGAIWDALGLHVAALRAYGIQRCSCGAFGPSPWFHLTTREAREKWRRR